jgi:hypothetical protein
MGYRNWDTGNLGSGGMVFTDAMIFTMTIYKYLQWDTGTGIQETLGVEGLTIYKWDTGTGILET